MKPSFFLACALAAAIAGFTAQQLDAASNTAAKSTHSKASKARDWTSVVSTTPAGGFLMGNPNAKVKLIEYGSMTCPHCARFEEAAGPSLSNYVKSGKVSLEFRNYVRDATDLTASLLARCGGTTAFFPVTRALFKDQARWEEKLTQVSEEQAKEVDDLPTDKKFLAVAKLLGFQQWAAAHGVPVSKSAKCLTSEESVNKLVEMTDKAKVDFPDFKGTPSFVINGTLIEIGPVAEGGVWPALESKIKSALGEQG